MENITQNLNQSWIIISDTHIGGNPEGSNVPNDNELCCFLEWVKHIDSKGERIWVKYEDSGYERNILPPSRFILLGDILDLWDPENSDRSYIIKRGAKPFSLIHDMKCDKVYVAGNHDEDIYELADVLEEDNSALNLGDYRLEVYRKHYPLNVDNGIMIGDIKYAFIHGHQYDKVQITETINKKFGIRFDPLDVVLDISNISIVKSVFKEKKQTIVYFGTAVVAGLILLPYLDYLTYIQEPGLTGILVGILEALLISYVILTPLVKAIAWGQGYVWNTFFKAKARDKTVKEVIDEGYYKESSDKMKDVNVVFFGHTHKAGSFYLESKDRLFVNTGGWVKETDGRKLNTFAYIDNDGIEVLSWTGRKEGDRFVFEYVCRHSASSLKPIN